MNPFSANFSAFRNIMDLKSRAPRSEYWWVLATLISGIFLKGFVEDSFFPRDGGTDALYSWLKFAYILTLLMWLAAFFSTSVRRLHDVDKSGKLMIFYLSAPPIALLVISYFCIQPGTPGPNRFGPNPLDPSSGGGETL